MIVDEQLLEGAATRGEHEVAVRAGRPSLASLLATAGVASEEQLRLAVAEGMGRGERLGEVVLRRGWIDEPGLARLLAHQWRLPFLADAEVEFAAGATSLASLEVARAHAACVIGEADGAPLLAVTEPNEERFAELRALHEVEPSFVVVTRGTLERLLDTLASEQARAQLAHADAAAAAADAADQERAEAIVSELDSATEALFALRARVEQLNKGRQTAEQELTDCHRQLASLEQERTRNRQRIEELELKRTGEQARLASLRAKLAELLAVLDE